MGARSTSQGRGSGLRKGAWTAEEDTLLRKCLEKYGVVKWSLVPERAGLNRCPKSCRLRWLNYLCPSIKRGNFDNAEVDLIIKLHKLLGNRWSLIAGRLPGRTANDIKNYWNTHLSKQLLVEREEKEASARYVEVVKPQPHTIPWNWKWSEDVAASPGKHYQEEFDSPKQPSSSNNYAKYSIDDSSIINRESVSFPMSSIEVGMMTQDMQTKFAFEDIESFGNDGFLLEGFGGWDDMHPDISLWRDFEPM